MRGGGGGIPEQKFRRRANTTELEKTSLIIEKPLKPPQMSMTPCTQNTMDLKRELDECREGSRCTGLHGRAVAGAGALRSPENWHICTWEFKPHP